MLFFEYLFWHYSTAIKQILAIAHNYLIASWFRFGIFFHLRTLLYPWHRQVVPPDDSEEGIFFTLLNKAAGWIADLYFRLIAALLRLSVVFGGLISCTLIFLIFLFIIIVWLFWPFIVLISISKGITLLTT